MNPIRMVDLAGQHARISKELDSAIQEVLDTTAFIKGPQVAAFERELAEYLGVKHVIGCANGTDALQLALMALNLPAGSEVITPDFTFVATAEVICLLGHTPVLVDVDPDTYCIDPAKIEAAITEKTKAIIPVHLFGQCADMDSIMAIARRKNLFVIEDNAQAIGADYTFKDSTKKKAGTIGHIGCTSFFPSKNLGCMGDGGAVMTNDEATAVELSKIANHGQEDQYYYSRIGINSRLDTIQAAVLKVKLKHLDEYNAGRQKAARYYDEAFSGVEGLKIPARNPSSSHIFHQYGLKVTNGKRDELLKYLESIKIPSKVYYPVPIHSHKPYADKAITNINELQNTIQLSAELISPPMHTELTDEQLSYITSAITDFFTNHK